MQPIFCFIDDSDFELDNFREHAAPAFKGVEFVYACDFDDAQRKLEDRRCLCFLLDIYGGSPKQDAGDLPAADQLAPALGKGFDIGQLYSGLEGEGAERANQFLRRLYGRVQEAQSAFSAAAQALGQSPAFGLGSLALVRQHYPWAAVLAYSRKALYADAADMCSAGADGVLQKPQGRDEAAIALATKQAAPSLAQASFGAVERRLAALGGGLGLGLCQRGVSLNLAEALDQGLRHLGPNVDDQKNLPVPGGLDKLSSMRLDDLELDEVELGLILSLRDWLNRES
jgi:DNA-binding NarL/FixJ family response regulator